MRQIRTNPGGFASGAYGVAFVIGSTATNVGTAGSGYAVVLGNDSEVDPLRLIRFDSGIGGSRTTLISAAAPLSDLDNQYLSIGLTYEPSSNLWSLSGRIDGTSSFQDPASGSLVSLGSVTDSTHTNIPLTNMGGYWQGNTAANQLAFFDNISVSVVPETSGPLIGILLGAGFALHRRRGAKGQQGNSVAGPGS